MSSLGVETACDICGTRFVKRSPSHQFCETCSIKRDRDRKAAWNGPHVARAANPERERLRAEAAESVRSSEVISWTPSEIGQDLAWLHRISLPFSYALSKNAVWSMAAGGGHVFMRKRASRAREAVRLALAEALREQGTKPVEAKVYIDLFVQKPNHKGDAINVIDSVCDGVKEAIGVDDRWFSIRGLDWEIVKDDPRIFVGVGQVATEHHRACSTCGRVLPMTGFGVRKHDRMGRAKECFGCRRATDRRPK